VISNGDLGVAELPRLRTDVHDPSAAWLAGVLTDDPRLRAEQLARAPQATPAVTVDRARALLDAGDPAQASALCEQLLATDPWEWRAVWLQGLIALQRNDADAAVQAFNAVYGQLPGELAPKLALARACELRGDSAVAQRLYAVCGRCDATYVAPSQFGLARLSAAGGQHDESLAALDRIPTTSRAYGPAQTMRLQVLSGPTATLPQLDLAARSIDAAGLDPVERLELRRAVLERALSLIRSGSAPAGLSLGGVSADERSLRLELEDTLRSTARLTDDRATRIQLVDLANETRPRTLW
jgi:serine/threonine-protein kinase PknG